MFTHQQGIAYDAWRTAGPPEDPCEEAFEYQAEMSLAELAEELESLMYADDELPSRQAANVEAIRYNAFDLLRKELTRLEDSPEVWNEDGWEVNPDNPIHTLIAHADALVGKAIRIHRYR